MKQAGPLYTVRGAGALILSVAAAWGSTASASDLTGHVDVVSRYYLRGQTSTYGNTEPLGNALADAPESDHPALQWGADYVHDSGFYAGYWGSTINYSYKQLGDSYKNRAISNFQRDKSIENDFYGGYNGTVGDWGYSLGLTYYYYINGTASNAPETKLALTYGPVTLSAQTLLQDVVWGNKGDTYWTAVYTRALPYQLSFTTTLGFYTYNKEGKYNGTEDTLSGASCGAGEAFIVNGCYAGKTPVSSAFRHLTFGLSQPIADTGLTWSGQFIVGGRNRFDVKQGNRAVFSLSYGF